MTSLAGILLQVVMSDDFEDPPATAGQWLLRQGASLPAGHTGLGWDISIGAGGTPLPIVAYEHAVDTTVLCSRHWLKVDTAGANADWMVWSNFDSGDQVTTNIYADGHVDFRRGGSLLAASSAGVVVMGTWQHHDVRLRFGDADGAAWWSIDGTTVIDVDGVDTHAGGVRSFFRLVLSTAGLVTHLDDVEFLVEAGGVKVWDGAAWVSRPVKVWNGSAWVTKVVRVHDGAGWVTV